MERLYTDSDVQRWQASNSRATEILARRIGGELSGAQDAQAVSMLRLTYCDMAFTQFALGHVEEALAYLRNSVLCMLRIFDLYSQGDKRSAGYIGTGHFQTVLTAYASGDGALASTMADRFLVDEFAREQSPKDSNYIGEALKAVCCDQFEHARSLLARPRPDIDSQFAGYVECLAAIASKDASAFEKSVRHAEESWYSFMRRRFKGHPQAVCFLGGLGFQRLAEAKLGKLFRLSFCGCEN